MSAQDVEDPSAAQPALQKLLGDLFGDSDDEDDEVPTRPVAVPQPDVQADEEEDDIFKDSDEEEKPAPKSTKLLGRARKEAAKEKKRKRPVDDSAKVASRLSKSQRRTTSSAEGVVSSGDEYDSDDEPVRTAQDDEFLASDDDDDLLQEYAQDKQNFKDERPDRYRPPGSGRTRDVISSSDNVVDKALMALKKPRRKVLDEKTKDALAEDVVRMMNRAKKEDDAIRKQNPLGSKAIKPAIHKLQTLTKVKRILMQQDMQEALLKAEVLGAINGWLQPSESGDLPSLDMRTHMYRVLKMYSTPYLKKDPEGGKSYLNCDLTKEHLKHSGYIVVPPKTNAEDAYFGGDAEMDEDVGARKGDHEESSYRGPNIGKIILYLSKHPSETTANKQLLEEIIEIWSKLVFTNLRRNASERVVDAQDLPGPRSSKRADTDGQGRKRKIDSYEVLEQARKEKPVEAFERVRVPISRGFNFKVKPQSKVDMVEKKDRKAPLGVKDRLLVRMKEMGKPNKNFRSENVKISGR